MLKRYFLTFALLLAFSNVTALAEPNSNNDTYNPGEPKTEENKAQLSVPAISSNSASGGSEHKEAKCQYNGPKWFAGFYCFFAGHEKFWVSFGTLVLAAFTTILGVATILLARATNRLVSGADDSAQRQLRAYVAVRVFHVSSFNEDKLIIFKFLLENTGATPARMVSHHAEVVVAPEPLPEDYKFPAIATPLSNPANIFPKQGFEGRVTATKPFTADEIRGIISGDLRIYCCGEAFYEDVFGGQGRRTNFCTSVVGDVDTMKKLSSDYKKTDLSVAFQIARTGNTDT